MDLLVFMSSEGVLSRLRSDELARPDQHGQFVLAVNQSLFEQAQTAEETGDIAEAERLYRILM
jgi:hypothetical protein